MAVQIAQHLVISAGNVLGDSADLAGDIGRAVLASLHPPVGPASALAGSSPNVT